MALEVQGRPREGVAEHDLGVCLFYGGGLLVQRGDRAGAEAAWQELAQLAERARDTSLAVLAMTCPAYLSVLDGRLEEAISLTESLARHAEELGVAAPVYVMRLLFYVGRGNEQTLQDRLGPGRMGRSIRAVVLAHLGRYEEVHAICAGFGDIGSDADESSAHILLSLLEAAILSSDHKTARALYRRLAPLADRLMVAGNFDLTAASVARYLGAAAALLGEPDEARAYYQQALEVCARVRFRPEIALVRLYLAELLLDRYPEERVQALEHLDFAIAELREMKMQPSLERALGHKGLLKA